ncbi:hypothetical protein D9O36_03470 [Zobellia amurskyensis]|uniref:Deoxyribose-phosphate aldolase n=1 Tax=Zobellia amurskyensis TaxID=248905 RepID=A0A7X2ZR87_9FLAO|nr:DUF6503 family protein [Zobellia amurskyensis]MUH34889.1 hypothetical protein [Zobellia amurskyensis]
MKVTYYLIILSVLVGFFSCKSKEKENAEESFIETNHSVDSSTLREEPNEAEILVLETIIAHGGNRYNKAHYGFTFRDKDYTFQNDGNKYIYTVAINDTIDTLDNGKLLRTVNGKPVSLSTKDNDKYKEALNSVIYFATLPHKLNDIAVNKTYIERIEINGEDYKAVEVSFDQKGGGTDHDDVFMYWINTNSKTVDYLAYKYETNNGGVRFRSAYNRRTVDGILFQDYINYKAPIGTPLTELPSLFEKKKLEELSKIETENVVNLAQ